MKSRAKPLQWLWSEVHGEHFVERQRIPIESRVMRGIDIAIYEYKRAAAGSECHA